MNRGILIIASLLLVAAAPAQFEQRILAAHNGARAEVGSAALAWDEGLARDALKWAERLAKNDKFEHAPPEMGTADQGENLWMGSKAGHTPEEMIGAWVDEKKSFKPGFFPAVTTTGSVDDVGHYTQLVWYATTRVGCGLASNAEDDYLVCRYGPPGNVIGVNPLEPTTKPVKKPKKPALKKRRRGG